MERCDNRSVGVVLRNERSQLALLTRKRFPVGIAPPAGHIDNHGSAEQAACDEVAEEIGISLAINGLRRTAIYERRVPNVCRRPGGSYHYWNVYEAQIGNIELQPCPDETSGARWYDRTEIQQLAAQTKLYEAGSIPEALWGQQPGLEPIWVSFLKELEYVW